MELEHLVSYEVLWSAILSSMAGADVPSPHTFLKILSGNGPEYDSNDVDCYAPPCVRYHIDSEALVGEAPEPMSPDQSPYNHANYLGEEGGPPAGLEAIEAELEPRRWGLAR